MAIIILLSIGAVNAADIGDDAVSVADNQTDSVVSAANDETLSLHDDYGSFQELSDLINGYTGTNPLELPSNYKAVIKKVKITVR